MAESTDNSVTPNKDSDNSDGGNTSSPLLLTENVPVSDDTSPWNFIVLLNIPAPDQFDHGDVTQALCKAGFTGVSGVKLAQYSNPMLADGTHSYATASVTTRNADMRNTSNASEVEIWSGFNPTQPLTLFSEICTALIDIDPRLLPPSLLAHIYQQASILQLALKHDDQVTVTYRLQVSGNCSQVHKFREYLAALCIQQVHVLHTTNLQGPVCDDVIEAPQPKVLPVRDDTGSSSLNNVFSNLSSDVLLLMPKLKTIRGVDYYPQEGRIEVTAIDPEERSKVISNFQESYQNIVGNRQLKTGTLDLPSSCMPQEIAKVVDQFNEKYHQCYFSYNPTCHSVKIISLSSRQFEQAKLRLKEAAGQPPSSNPSPLHGNADGNVQVLVLSNEHIVTVKKGDMVVEEADVIVNAANRDLKHWGGLARALDVASKGELQKHSDVYTNKCGQVAPGGVAITNAGGRLRCKYVIHAVGPIASECKNESLCQELIFKAITSTLNKAQSVKAVSIVLPALSTGVYSVHPLLSAKATFNAITSFKYQKDCLKDIRIVILDGPTYQCFAKELTAWRPAHGDNGIPKLERSLSDQGMSSSSLGGGPPPGLTSSSVVTRQPIGSTDSLPNVIYPNLSTTTDEHGISTTSMSSTSSNSGPTVSGIGPGVTPTGSIPLLKPASFQPNKLLPDQFPIKGNKPDSSTVAECPICFNSTATDPIVTHCCKQEFCRGCLDRALQSSSLCPTCRMPLRPVRGNQPPGTMHTTRIRQNIPGYMKYGAIKIDYYFNGGTQGPDHPNPGQRYSGTTRTAYLPNNEEGNYVLQLLKRAFDAGLVFTIGTSVTSGAKNTVVWNDVHHKTNTHGGPTNYGYPDPTYLKRVREELKAKGIY